MLENHNTGTPRPAKTPVPGHAFETPLAVLLTGPGDGVPILAVPLVGLGPLSTRGAGG